MTWLTDEGVSGAVPPESRKQFKAALALLEAGESADYYRKRASKLKIV
jgi:hypothetical protein